MIGVGAAAVIVSDLDGTWLSRRALRPITNITAAAASIAKTDDLSTRLKWTGPQDEVGNLVSVFNDMMGRLQDLFSVQQRFVADVSHELRTPLTAIKGNVEIIRRYGMDEMSLEAIESETERMTRMVNDLLLLARADYGGLTLELEPLDLDTVALEAHQQARVLVKDRDITVALGRFEPVRVRGHADRMKQLLLNLLSNAIKFTPDGGRITLSLYPEGENAVLQVADTGIGIAEEDLKRIFERFWQADSSRVRGVQNTESSAGLGLAIVKWIVDAHDATIDVESEFGQGTAFTVKIPLLQSDKFGERPVTGSRLRRLRSSIRRGLLSER
jgi:two-component system, OmpR family, sensor kinase